MESDALQTKLTQLKITVQRTKSILESGKRESIKRQLEALKMTLHETDQCKRAVETKKITEKEDLSEINEWNDEVNTKMDEADGEVSLLQGWLDEKEKEARTSAQEEQFKFELKLHEKKLKLQAEVMNTTPEPSKSTTLTERTAKLPKLEISKFEGSYMDWPRFWGQFTEAIDKSNLAPITKFTYLCEHLDPKVKRVVEALPFTAEGYNRAKSILQDRFGKESEIVKSYIKEIMDLPHVTSASPNKISEFSEKLSYCVQALDTMKKLDQVAGNVSMTLDKLPGIRGDLVRTDPDWESWDFVKLTEALRQWVRRNPVDKAADREREENNRKRERNRLFQARRKEYKPKGCVYCEDESHKATECQKVTDITERKGILMQKGLCFNCATRTHRASECQSKTSCQHCKRRHHSSICEQSRAGNGKKLLMDGKSGDAIFPIVVVKVDGITCRALIDSGAGSSYASAKLIDLLKKKPSETKTQRIDMLMSSQVTRMETYDAVIESLDNSYQMNVRLTKVNKGELLTIDNPKYDQLIKEHQHLKQVEILDHDKKQQLPIHVILGSGEYARIKTDTKPLVGKDGEPVAEKTKVGWFIISPGAEFDKNTVLMTQTSQSDYENLCRLDVLGLADSPENDQEIVYQDFKEQLRRSSAGWYETNLPWKANHPQLPTNEQGSRRRLEQLVKKLQREGDYDNYDKIIQDQLQQGVVEPAPKVPSGKESYLPHKGVVKREAETTKLRIVYDASARESNHHPSLHDCLHPGPPLQNLLWSILVKSRFYPVLLTGDLQKAFLQVRIKKEERDALRFLWKPPGEDRALIYRFTRAVFGLTCSPFLLGGVISQHLKSWELQYPEMVKELRDGLYVDDLMIGGSTVEDVAEKKSMAIEVFGDATFALHKWHANMAVLENDEKPQPENEELTFAKQQFRSDPLNLGTKLLGLVWDKRNDSLGVAMGEDKTVSTKRGALSGLAKIYDPLGLVSPTTLQGKLLYREICEANIAWDGELPKPLQKRWNDWSKNLPELFTVKRSLAPYLQPVTEITLHAFGDASKDGVSATVYAVVQQEQGTTQGLVCAKSRLAKRNLTIPRLELVAGHMAVNLATNVQTALSIHHEPTIHCWLDSTVALYWINGRGEYRQFVANRVHKIQQHRDVKWHHVPTTDNPADLGSRGGSVIGQELWKDGPAWLSDSSKWPPAITPETCPDVEREIKTTRSILTTAVRVQDEFDGLLESNTLRKMHRIGAWGQRFIHNCRNPSRNRKTGPLDTTEIEQQKVWWIKRTQHDVQNNDHFEEDKLQLNLQLNHQLILECRGRIEGEYPVYLPENHPYTQKVVQQAHLCTLHGGVAMTMAKVREVYWVPRLRREVKRIRGDCWGCKRIRARAFQSPPPGNLPSTRTQGSTPFEVIGVDFAGPIHYQTRGKSSRKAYLALFGCSLTRAVHLELLKSLETNGFITCLKRFIARRGKPKLIYSDNGSTFKATQKWLKQVQTDEHLNSHISDLSIEWRFNLSRAPWWGGQFERLIGLFKGAFYKTIGNGTLKWEELEEVVIDVETTLNNRPLCYLEDDVELPVLTPYSMMHVNPSYTPELEAYHIEETKLRRRARFLKSCKEAMWNRWRREYVRGLREQHRRAGGKQVQHPKVGEAVIIADRPKNRNKWKLAIVTGLITGRDGIVRAAKLKTTKGNLERAIQQLCPLELSCDINQTTPLDPTSPSFEPRAKRDAASAASLRIQQLADMVEEDD